MNQIFASLYTQLNVKKLAPTVYFAQCNDQAERYSKINLKNSDFTLRNLKRARHVCLTASIKGQPLNLLVNKSNFVQLSPYSSFTKSPVATILKSHPNGPPWQKYPERSTNVTTNASPPTMRESTLSCLQLIAKIYVRLWFSLTQYSDFRAKRLSLCRRAPINLSQRLPRITPCRSGIK